MFSWFEDWTGPLPRIQERNKLLLHQPKYNTANHVEGSKNKVYHLSSPVDTIHFQFVDQIVKYNSFTFDNQKFAKGENKIILYEIAADTLLLNKWCKNLV